MTVMKMGMNMKSETMTLILVNLAGIMERADESLLPGVYKEVGAALHTDPTGLGSLTLFRSLVQTSCYPLAAYLALRYNRAHVAISRGLNGIGLAIVTPAIQSLVADSTDETNRGMAFGWLQLTGNIGSIIGGLCAVLIASTSFMGIPGWRVAFHLVGLISVTVGILVRLFASDPRHSDSQPKNEIQHKSFRSELKDVLIQAKSVMQIPSFQIIVAQGVFGSFPWSAMSFCPMWLELIGFSHKTVALLWTLFVIAGSLGGLPDDPSTAFLHGMVLFIMGLSISWNGPATNNPIFAEIVPERMRTSIYALDRSFESILASFAPPIVGILAQHVFGYKPIPKGSSDSEEIKTDRENAIPLARALYTAIGIPFVICCTFYSFLYCSYPRDRERARMHALIESEMQRIETTPSAEEYSQIHIVGLNEHQEKERSVSEVEYGEESLDFDENDEKKLLSNKLPLSDSVE
ncbi:unnamed protein product [Thlaspi arvense]|uniref:Major facilitator superfamily (MFS) profile domain-containing protein n=1 Tax=Thlaspi arvense TaxID=13288 RepID=A0AAU9S7S1_THLAR|nr:unnamed protein product [Thlaspi arvense]